MLACENLICDFNVIDVRLFRGIDSLHDDSFQLCQLPQLSLQRALFPLGDFSKEVVRSVANSTPFLKSPHLMVCYCY